MPELRVIENGEERIVSLDDRPLVVGREEDCDIRLVEVRSSRRHCVLESSDRGVSIRDLESSNGTRVNGARVSHRLLVPADEVGIGEVRIVVEATPPPERPAPPKPPRTRGAGYLLAPAVLLTMGLFALAVADSYRDEEIADARDRSARVDLERIILLESDEARITAMGDWIEKHPRHPSTDEARLARDELERMVRDARQATEELAAVTAANENVSADRLRRRLEDLRLRYLSVPGFDAKVRDRMRALARHVRAESEEDLRATRERVGAALAAKDYAAAVATLHQLESRWPTMDRDLRAQVESERTRVLERTRDAWVTLEGQADALRASGRNDEVDVLLRGALAAFAGTPVHGQIRAKLEGGRDPGESDQPSPEAAAAESEVRRTRKNAYLLAQEAEELARAGLTNRAIQRFEEILASSKDPAVRAEFAGRIDDLTRTKALLDRVFEAARTEPKRLARARLGATGGRVVGADDEAVLIQAKGATLRRNWSDLSVADLVALAEALSLQPVDRLALAVLRFDRGDRDGWVETLVEAMKHEELRETIGAIYARKEGIALPEGGFVAHRGRMLTRADYERERHEEEISELLQKFSAQLAKVDGQPGFRVVARMKEKRASLEAARKHALKLIYDERRYFYPYRDRMAEYVPVQREVEARTVPVRELWDDPAKVLLKRSPEASRAIKELQSIASKLALEYRYDHRALGRAIESRLLYLPEKPETHTLRTFPISKADRERVEYDARVMAYNEERGGAAERSEKDQVRITNEYRMMFGRPAIVRVDELVMAARKHSDEMARLGYFGHFSPIPERKNPMLRVKLEGYKGMPVSENCHSGSGDPQGAHQGWIRSSGHHRNLLQAFWTDMGTGRSGRLWTQNFGRTRRLPADATVEEATTPR